MVGTIPLRSILWIAAAETSLIAASCWSDKRCARRSPAILGPTWLTISSTWRDWTAMSSGLSGLSALGRAGLTSTESSVE
ncbi:unannotated protein [freshwater metagenome]|uniref:Unannotated protein n=1 Tax=freshwater metagenome TaxID=449393 RepID=A0A6J7BZP8_9ZZZZ